MKIAITSQGRDMNAQIDPRFGRCQYFIIVDLDTKSFEVLDNANISAGSGAGISAAQNVAEKEVKAILTGTVGPNAFQGLSAAGIEIYTGLTGTIEEAVNRYEEGILNPDSAPSAERHHGLAGNTTVVNESPNKKRIAIAAEGDQGLEANVSAHFGRCPYYTIVEVEGEEITLNYHVENPFYSSHGAPGQVPGFIHDQGAQVIIAGGMGQRAVGFFNEFGIEAVTGAAGKVQAVVDGYLHGAISGVSPCEHD